MLALPMSVAHGWPVAPETLWECDDAAHGRLSFGLCAVCLHGGAHVGQCDGQFAGWPPCPCIGFAAPGDRCPQCDLDLAAFKADLTGKGELTGERWRTWVSQIGLPTRPDWPTPE